MSYIVKNCPAIFHSGITPKPKCWQKWEQFDESCQDCTDCVIKQVIEKCKEEVNVSKQQGNYTLHYSNLLAEQILDMFEIEEVNK